MMNAINIIFDETTDSYISKLGNLGILSLSLGYLHSRHLREIPEVFLKMSLTISKLIKFIVNFSIFRSYVVNLMAVFTSIFIDFEIFTLNNP